MKSTQNTFYLQTMTMFGKLSKRHPYAVAVTTHIERVKQV